MFSRLANSFSQTVTDNSGGAHKSIADAPPPPSGVQVSGAAFSARVSETVRRRQPSSAGKFQIVRLDRISDALGDRWPAIQERVMQVAERVLQKRLTRVDCFSRADDRSFLVLFVELSEEQARFKAKSVADEILGIVMGEVDSGSNIGLRSGVADIGRLALTEPLTSEELSLALETETETEIAAEHVAENAENNENSLIGGIEIEYRPTLNVRTGYVAIFEGVPLRRLGTRVRRGQDFYPGGSGELNLKMNLKVVSNAIAGVQQARVAGRKFRAVLPIHFDAISSRYRHELIDLLKTLDQDTRATLVFDIVGCIAGTPSVRLGEVTSALAPFCRAMSMRVALDHQHIDALANLGLTAIGTDLNDREVDGSTLHAVTALARRVRTIGLQPFVFGVRSADMIAPLAALGVEYINGPAIGPARQAVGALERYPHPLPPARPVLDLVPVSGLGQVRSAAE